MLRKICDLEYAGGLGMKRIFSEKKNIWFAILFIALISFSGLSTFAYYSAQLGMLTNQLTVATITTEILEEPPVVSGLSILKAPEVKNTGSVDCLVRVRLIISPQSLVNPATFNGIDSAKWQKIGDYYYYKGAVAPNATTGKIFTSISGLTDSGGKFLITQYPEIKDFQVTIYQEAVQAVFYQNGTKITALNSGGTYDATSAAAIWAIYDNN